MFGVTEGHLDMTQEVAEEIDLRAGRLAGLHAMADYLTAHPDFPIPSFTIGVFVDTKEKALELVGQGGRWTKSPSGPYFYFHLSFHPKNQVRLWLAVNREVICERVVVGRKWIEPAPASEGFFADDVEWICPDSIMKVGGGDGSS